MRRKDRKISNLECLEILNAADYGILSLSSDDMPYGVPVNYVYKDGHIYFHCAKEGHKLDLIRINPNVSFCVIGFAEVIPSMWTSGYESVICKGVARIVEDSEIKRSLIYLLCEKLCPEYIEQIACLKGMMESMMMVEIEVKEMTGKRNNKHKPE